MLQSSSMSMATEPMVVVDDIVSNLEKLGQMVDPTNVMLATFDESAMHHDGGYDYSEKCLKLLFILHPEHKASKLLFICGEMGAGGCTLGQPGESCSDDDQCCSNCKYHSTR